MKIQNYSRKRHLCVSPDPDFLHINTDLDAARNWKAYRGA